MRWRFVCSAWARKSDAEYVDYAASCSFEKHLAWFPDPKMSSMSIFVMYNDRFFALPLEKLLSGE